MYKNEKTSLDEIISEALLLKTIFVKCILEHFELIEGCRMDDSDK